MLARSPRGWASDQRLHCPHHFTPQTWEGARPMWQLPPNHLDAKLYAKVIAMRLMPLIPQWISKDQTGFIPGREARDNSLRKLSLISYVRGCSQPTLLLSTDAEKAFDRVDWEYLLSTLQHLGMGLSMLRRISAMYQSPSAPFTSTTEHVRAVL